MYIFLKKTRFLFISAIFVFFSCQETKSKVVSNPIKNIGNKVVGEKKDSAIKLKADSIIDISGSYELIKGETFFVDAKRIVIQNSELIISRLSETDFGFYSAYKEKDITPISDFGVLRSFKNKFYRIKICNGKGLGFDANAQENFTAGTYLYNQVMIRKKGNLLSVIKYGSNIRRYLIYKKKKSSSEGHISLQKTLEKAKYAYRNYMREYNKAQNYDKNKLQIEHVFKDSIWVSKHSHKEEYASFEYLHSYTNPYQNGRFIKQDSIFYKEFNAYK